MTPHSRAALRPGTSSPAREDSRLLAGLLVAAHTAADAADAITLRTLHAVRSGSPGKRAQLIEQAISNIAASVIESTQEADRAMSPSKASSPGMNVRWSTCAVDGAENLRRGIPMFATHLAVLVDEEPQIGLVSAPGFGRRWWAARGLGAWTTDARTGRRRQAMRVSAVTDLDAAHVVYRTLGDGSRVAFAARRLLRAAGTDNGHGECLGLALVAEGAADIALDDLDAVPDAQAVRAAGLVLVEEAGGRMTDLDGRRATAGQEILASNGLLHASVRAFLEGTDHEREAETR